MKKYKINPHKPPRLKEQVRDILSYDVIDHSCEVYTEDGRFVAHLKKGYFARQAEKYLEILNSCKFPHSNRASGLVSRSHIFGFSPREPFKKLPCRECQFNFEQPIAYKTTVALLKKISTYYKAKIPAVYEKQIQALKPICDAYKIEGTVFTSGIINKNTKYRFHTDNGNVKNTFATMFYAKKGIIGGDLILPEYNLKLSLDSGDLIVFDNTRVSHGVTPIKKMNKDSVRFSVVAYCLDRLRSCEKNLSLEAKHFNRIKD